MKRRPPALLSLGFVLAVLFAPLPSAAQQGPVLVRPHELYRFRISNADLGYILTSEYQEGVNLGFTFDGVVGAIYPVPAPGYTPDPAAGLVPLHRWTVVENGWRVHTYHSTYYFPKGSNYTYNGIRGYVFPPQTTSRTLPSGVTASLSQLSIFYSQAFGFWNGRGGVGFGFIELPPHGSFAYQGVIAAMPGATSGTRPGFCPQNASCFLQPPHDLSVVFSPPPPPPPPPTCNPDDETYCYMTGGSWDSSNCYCQYWGGGGPYYE